MASLMNAVQKKGLKKAADAGHDPADLSTGGAVSSKVGESAGQMAVGKDGRNAGSGAGEHVSTSAGAPAGEAADNAAASGAGLSSDGTAGNVESKTAAQSTVGNDSEQASDLVGRKAGTSVVRNTGKKASSKKKPGRRIGRPAGPDRTALTVRILSEIDDALTEAVDATGMSPQYIADDALRAWLIGHGYMERAAQAS